MLAVAACKPVLEPSPPRARVQASLVALSLLGEPLAPAPLSPITNTVPTAYGAPGMPGMPLPGMLHPQPPAYMQPPAAGLQPQHMQQQQQPVPPLAPNPAEAAAALAAELGVDSVTAQRIAELQAQKEQVGWGPAAAAAALPHAVCAWVRPQLDSAFSSCAHPLPACNCATVCPPASPRQQAVQREDYDEAKRLKGCVDRLKAAGGAIAGLEARKRAAVEAEDYDLAKQLKLQVDRMRWVTAGERSGLRVGAEKVHALAGEAGQQQHGSWVRHGCQTSAAWADGRAPSPLAAALQEPGLRSCAVGGQRCWRRGCVFTAAGAPRQRPGRRRSRRPGAAALWRRRQRWRLCRGLGGGCSRGRRVRLSSCGGAAAAAAPRQAAPRLEPLR